MKCFTLLLHLLALCSIAAKSKPLDLLEAQSNVAFGSPKGQQLLLSPKTSLVSFFKTAQHFVTQDTLGFCGHASATVALNAVRSNKSAIPQDKRYPGYRYYTQQSWVSQRCVGQALGMNREGGMGLDALKEAVNCNAYAEAVVVNSSDSEDAVVKALRRAMDAGRIVIVNVFRHELKEKGWGHFSPLGAYNVDKDGQTRFLFLDVARYKYEPIWVTAEVLVPAMSFQDPLTRQSRGYLVVSGSDKQSISRTSVGAWSPQQMS